MGSIFSSRKKKAFDKSTRKKPTKTPKKDSSKNDSFSLQNQAKTKAETVTVPPTQRSIPSGDTSTSGDDSHSLEQTAPSNGQSKKQVRIVIREPSEPDFQVPSSESAIQTGTDARGGLIAPHPAHLAEGESAFETLAKDDDVWSQTENLPEISDPRTGAERPSPGSLYDNIKANMSPVGQDVEIILRTMVSSPDYRAKILGLRESKASDLLESIQTWLDHAPAESSLRRTAIYVLIKLARASGIFPPSLSIGNDLSYESTIDPVVTSGGMADIFRAKYRDSQMVAVKRPRIAAPSPSAETSNSRKTLPYNNKIFAREALVWRQLRHKNLVPFMGLDETTWQTAPGIVTVWMSNGTLKDYVQSPKYIPAKHRVPLLRGVANGLDYLHSLRIVHGDITNVNVLLDKDGIPCLADFGLIVIGRGSAMGLTNTNSGAGSQYWMAPERLDPQDENDRRSQEADIYAYGCLCYAVCCGNPPFWNLTPFKSTTNIVSGLRPDRPKSSECIQAAKPSDDLWNLTAQCWAQSAKDRPTSEAIVGYWSGNLSLRADGPTR